MVEHRADNNQSELSRRSGLRHNHVSTIITRLRKDPERDIERDTLIKIAHGGGVSLRWLSTGEGDPNEMDIPEGKPVMANLAGWDEAERQVRTMLRSTPEYVFTHARQLTAMLLPDVADVDLVYKAVQLASKLPPPGVDTPETKNAKRRIARLKARKRNG